MIDGYNSGYTCALLHLQRNFKKMAKDGFAINKKTVLTYLNLAIENREELRETGWIEGVKYNSKRGFFKEDV